MKPIEKVITSWSDFYSVIHDASYLSDPSKAQPVGSAKFWTVEKKNRIARLVIMVDILPK